MNDSFDEKTHAIIRARGVVARSDELPEDCDLCVLARQFLASVAREEWSERHDRPMYQRIAGLMAENGRLRAAAAHRSPGCVCPSGAEATCRGGAVPEVGVPMSDPDAEALALFPRLAAFPGVPRWRPWLPPPDDPYIADIRSFDIPETIAACIRNARPGMVAITLSRRGGQRMVEAAETAAGERGAVVLWWDGPDT